MPVFEANHPLIKHKLGLLRAADRGIRDFRRIVSEIATLLTYEATADLELENHCVTGWAGPVPTQRIRGKKLVLVPILRAGLGMLDGVLEVLPTAKVGVVGLQRNEKTLEPDRYFEKLMPDMHERIALILDPMLATGGSAAATVDMLKEAGCKTIKAMFLVAAPEGIHTMTSRHPDVSLYIAGIDEKLNENGYILPGLGDAGDRIFGTIPKAAPEGPAKPAIPPMPREIGGPEGPEPTRYGDWEHKGRCSDF